MKNNYKTIFQNEKIAAYYSKIIKHKATPPVAITLLFWAILKEKIVFVILILFSFLVAIIVFALVITYFEEKNKMKEGGDIIAFPVTSSSDKVIICDMCENLIDNSEEFQKLSSDPSIFLCAKCKLKYHDGVNNP